jgi:hypothetical protein
MIVSADPATRRKSSSTSYPETAITTTDESIARMRSITSGPASPGITMSTTHTLMSPARNASIALAPS